MSPAPISGHYFRSVGHDAVPKRPLVPRRLDRPRCSRRLRLRAAPRVMAMTDAPLDVLARQIDEAWVELLGARADWAHSPNSSTLTTVTYAEGRVNRLLDRLAQTMTPEQMAEAAARPVRTMADVG